MCTTTNKILMNAASFASSPQSALSTTATLDLLSTSRLVVPALLVATVTEVLLMVVTITVLVMDKEVTAVAVAVVSGPTLHKGLRSWSYRPQSLCGFQGSGCRQYW